MRHSRWPCGTFRLAPVASAKAKGTAPEISQQAKALARLRSYFLSQASGNNIGTTRVGAHGKAPVVR